MLHSDYLVHGLNALSRAHTMHYFQDGHRGGAIISGYYLCLEEDVESGAAKGIQEHIDTRWLNTELCAPFPEEDPDPDLAERIPEAMLANMGGLVEAGHNTILPTLALKAFADRPDAVTPSRCRRICRLVESFGEGEYPDSGTDVMPPPASDGRGFAEFILREFVDCCERFDHRGQGWSGHLLTYGRAVRSLSELGLSPVLERAEQDLLSYVHRIRIGPRDGDIPRDEHAPLEATPLEAAYWDGRPGDPLGHRIEDPYGFYGLYRHLGDEQLRERCRNAMYRVF